MTSLPSDARRDAVEQPALAGAQVRMAPGAVTAAPGDTAGAYMWVVLAMAVVVQISYSLPTQGIGAIAPFLQADLAMTREQIGLFVSFSQIGMSVTFLPGGWAVDRFGSRRVTAVGLALVGAALLSMSQARDPLMVYLGALLGGSGVGVASPAVTMMVMHWFPARTRGTAMGIKQSGTPLGGIVAAMWLSTSSQLMGWRTALAASVVAILVGVVLALLLYRDPAGFHRAERRSSGFFLSSTVLRRPILVLTAYQAVLVGAQFCVIGYTVLFATEWLGRDPVTAAGALSVALAGGMVGRVGWGVLSDRLFHSARKPALIVAGVLSVIALGAQAALPPTTPLVVVLAIVFIVGVAVLGWQGVGTAMMVEQAGTADAGRVVGFILTVLQIGPIVGPPLIGRLLDTTGSYPLAWSLIAASCGLATLGFALAMPETATRRARTETR